MKVLVVSGATREPMDSVRFITNMSSGATGATIAEILNKKKFHVTYLAGQGAPSVPGVARTLKFGSYADLKKKIITLSHSHSFGAVIFLAAVSDYSVASVKIDGRVLKNTRHIKIPSGKTNIAINLKTNDKLIDLFKTKLQKKPVILVGFKLTHTPSKKKRERAVEDLFAHSHADIVVHNDLGDIGKTKDHHPFHVFRNPLGTTKWIPPHKCNNAQQLALFLARELRTSLRTISKRKDAPYDSHPGCW